MSDDCCPYKELDKDGDHPKTIGTSSALKLLNRFANVTVCKSPYHHLAKQHTHSTKTHCLPLLV